MTSDYLARRGRNERTELLRPLRANRANVLPGAASGWAPPNPGSTTRLTSCPVKRSIARIESSSTGATMVIAWPTLPALPVHIIFGRGRHVIVDDMRNQVDI